MLRNSRLCRLLPGVGLALMLALAAALLWGAPVSAAGDRYVATTGTDAGTCDDSLSPCLTLAYAVAQAAAGDTIHIAAGTYSGAGNQHVVIGKPLTLDGGNADATFLEYDPNVPATAGREGIVEIRSSDVTLRNLTMRYAPVEGGVPLWAVRIWKDGATVANIQLDTVKFLNNAGRGLELHNNTTITNLSIVNCVFADNPTHGIRLSSTTTVNGLTIASTTFNTNGHSGLLQSAGTGFLTGLHVDDSFFNDNAVQSLMLVNVHDVVIENSIFNGGERGIVFSNGANAASPIGAVEIRQNTLSNFATAAIWVNLRDTALDDPVTIANNVITQDVNEVMGTAHMIDIGLAPAETNAVVDVVDNEVTLTGSSNTAFAAALRLGGGLTSVLVRDNVLDGKDSGPLQTSGIHIPSKSFDYGEINPGDSIDITTNTITGFDNGITIYDEYDDSYGGLPAGSGLSIVRNRIAGNSDYGVRGGPPTAAEATCNWWGAASGPSGQGPGSGDAVSAYVIFAPWLPNDDVANALCGGVNDLFLGTNRGGSVGGVSFNDVDILALDRDTGTWSKFFEGRDVNVSTNLTGFTFEPGGCLLISFNGNEKKLGLGTVKPHDVLKFCPTELGETTSGTWSVYLDGSDVGLSAKGEEIDGLDVMVMPGGETVLLLSTKGNFAVKDGANKPLTGRDEDIIAFYPTTVGANTTGSFEMVLDGSTIPGLLKEDITGLYYNPLNGDLHISMPNAFNVGGVKGDANDIIILRPAGGGYTVLPYWDGAAEGYNYVLRSMHIDLP